MVRVLIDHDVITIPQPAINEVIIVRRNREVGSVKPESVPVTSPKVKNMPRTKAESEASVFEWTLDAVVRIVTPCVVSDPRTVHVNVGSFRMSRPVGKGPPFWHVRLDSGRFAHGSRCRATSGNMSTAKLTMLPALGICGDEGYRQYCKKPNSLLHDRHLQLPRSNWESNAS
jgi:hypothetical protein